MPILNWSSWEWKLQNWPHMVFFVFIFLQFDGYLKQALKSDWFFVLVAHSHLLEKWCDLEQKIVRFGNKSHFWGPIRLQGSPVISRLVYHPSLLDLILDKTWWLLTYDSFSVGPNAVLEAKHDVLLSVNLGCAAVHVTLLYYTPSL